MNKIIRYNIIPVSKPRMVQSDRWRKRAPVLKYFAFKDECRLKKVRLHESGDHIIFIMPMPKSWSKKKRIEMNNNPHQQRPDCDNLCKALFDAIFDEDCHIWNVQVTKVWGEKGAIVVGKCL